MFEFSEDVEDVEVFENLEYAGDLISDIIKELEEYTPKIDSNFYYRILGQFDERKFNKTIESKNYSRSTLSQYIREGFIL